MSSQPTPVQAVAAVAAGEQSAAGWYATVVLAIAYVFSYMDRQILTLLIEPIRRDLAISDTQVSLLSGLAFALCYCIAALPLGRWADAGNRRNIIAMGVLVWSAMTAACGVGRSFVQLFIFRMGVGIGEAALPPAAYSMLADYFSREKLALPMSIFVVGAPLGGGLALIAGGSIVEIVAGLPPIMLGGVALQPWQAAFAIIGGAGFFVALLTLTIREPARTVDHHHASSLTVEKVSIAAVGRFLMSNRRLFLPLLLGLSLGNMFSYGAMAWLPTFLIRTYGWTLPEAGTAVGTLLLVCGCCGAPMGGWIVQALTRRGYRDACPRTMLGGFVLLLPCIVVVALANSAPVALVFMAPIMFAIFMNAGVFPTLIQIITPGRMRAQVSAVVLLVTNLAGLGLGPTLYALTTDYVFEADALLRYSLLCVSVLLLSAAIVFMLKSLRPYRSANS
jgi:MFS family permease